jgi:hypothetical protein
LAIVGAFVGGEMDRRQRLSEQDRANELQATNEKHNADLDLLKRLFTAIDASAREANGLSRNGTAPKSAGFTSALSQIRTDITTVENIGIEAKLTLSKQLVDEIHATWQSLIDDEDVAKKVAEGTVVIREKSDPLQEAETKFQTAYNSLLKDSRSYLGIDMVGR